MAELEAETTIEQRAINAQHLTRLLAVSKRLSSILHLDDLLSMVMDVATELTDTEAASILLLDRKTEKLYFAATKGGNLPKEIEVPMNSIAGWVVQNGRSIVLSDVQQDERFYTQIDAHFDFSTRSMLAVPLITQNGAIGALEVLNKRLNRPYTEQDMALMEALASQSAVAIVNARLFTQSDLLAEIMHELKTPLMAITSASELMTRPDFPEDKMTEMAQMIRRESLRLANMTRDFVDFARLESGRMRLEKEPVPLPTLIAETVSVAESTAVARSITIKMDLANELPAADGPWRLIGDANLLKQVLVNLVSNAVKYNRRNGRITINARVVDGQLLLAVADTGHGIAPEDLAHLFERFYRVPTTARREGSGLGLSIAKKIVEAHNGRIEVESEVGVGTTFLVTLPLTPAGR